MLAVPNDSKVEQEGVQCSQPLKKNLLCFLNLLDDYFQERLAFQKSRQVYKERSRHFLKKDNNLGNKVKMKDMR